MRGVEITDPIQTERLMLRPFRPRDFDALLEMRSNSEVVRYLYWGPQSEAEVRAALEQKVASRAIRAEGDVIALAAVLTGTDELVADLILRLVSLEHQQGEIGFIVHPKHQGRGYATEAARPLLRIAFEELGLHRVVGRLEARNLASARVLEKLGMRREAHLVENELVKGEWQSELVYAMLDREWRAIAG
ncbi:MAG TPA: GNAT family protein [Actinomycetota bacterium]|nr:GNAT family protein [Actinomycetota bacterium]